jgi:hypothetical protein
VRWPSRLFSPPYLLRCFPAPTAIAPALLSAATCCRVEASEQLAVSHPVPGPALRRRGGPLRSRCLPPCFPCGRLIVAGHPRSTSVPTGTSPSFAVAPQCSTTLPTAPKTAGQPPSPVCPFHRGSQSWTTLVSFFQSRFQPQIISPHAGAAQAADPHSLVAGHRRNRPGAAAQCHRPRLPCF